MRSLAVLYKLILLWIVLIPLSKAYAQGSSEALRNDAEVQAQDMYHSFMSPYCPGRTLSACPSDKARELREEILTRLESGETQTLIETDLFSRYGEELRGTPRTEGFGLLGWILPLVIILIGALVVIRRLRRHTDEQEKADVDEQYLEKAQIEFEDKLRETEKQ